MLDPIGYLNGKPVFGPVCPLEMFSLVPGVVPTMADIDDGLDAARDRFERLNDIRFTSLRSWETPPTGLTCPASTNGWNIEGDHVPSLGNA
jgi:hypothetical protein